VGLRQPGVAKASPLLIPAYWYLPDWINAFHQTANPRVAVLHQLISLDLTLMAFCCYQSVKPYLPGKAS
jgi:hypothetical protein